MNIADIITMIIYAQFRLREKPVPKIKKGDYYEKS